MRAVLAHLSLQLITAISIAHLTIGIYTLSNLSIIVYIRRVEEGAAAKASQPAYHSFLSKLQSGAETETTLQAGTTPLVNLSIIGYH